MVQPMALMARLRKLLQRPSSTSRVGARRPSAVRHGDTGHEDALRAMLADDPNNVDAFRALAEIVRRRAAAMGPDGDPLTGPHDDVERQRAADLAVWSLGEEFAGHPRAWYPLVELARLSVHDDHEGTLRRLTTATERDASGLALAEALAVLREADLPVDALNLGVGHWRPRDNVPEAGRQLVLAALEAERPLDARRHLAALEVHPDVKAVDRIRDEVAPRIAAAERLHS